MKWMRVLAVVTAILLMTCLFTACHKGGDEPEVSEASIDDGIPVSEDWEMTVGETKMWIPFDDAEEDVIFRNSDIRFAELHAGKSTAEIVAIAAGETTLTADWGDKHYRIHVVVKDAPKNDDEVIVYDERDTPAPTDPVPQ